VRIVLSGFMGAGKTTVGRLVAEHLGAPFVDLDEAIERRTGRSIREIFADGGEPAFRAVERSLLDEELAPDPLVLAVGGGTLIDADVLERVRARAFVVWLHPSFATVVRRIGALGKPDRPLFRDEAAALELYRQRLPSYARSDLKLDIGPDESAREVAARLVLALPKGASCST